MTARMSEQREALAKALRTHADRTIVARRQSEDVEAACACGASLGSGSEFGPSWVSDAHLAHVADALAQMLADAEQRGADRVAAAVEAALEEGPDTWTPYDSRDTGETFLAESVLDFINDLRAALTTGAADRARAEEGGDRG